MQCRRANTYPTAARSDTSLSTSLEDSNSEDDNSENSLSEDNSLEDSSSEDDHSDDKHRSPSPELQHDNFDIACTSPESVLHEHRVKQVNKILFKMNAQKQLRQELAAASRTSRCIKN